MRIDKNFNKTLILAAVLLGIMVLATMFIGLGKGGFAFSTSGDTALFNFLVFQFLFYVGFGVAFLLGVLIVNVIEMLVTTGDSKYGNTIFFNSPGEFPSINIEAFKNPYTLIFGSIIACTIFGLFTSLTHQTFTGVGVLAHQFTLTDNLVYSAALIPAAENLGAAFAFCLVLVFFRQFARKIKMSKASFGMLTIFLAILTFATYGFINHQLRYGFSDVALYSVILFWAVGGLLTVVTGSFLPFWILHIANNLFYSLSANFSSDVIMTNTIVTVIIFALIFTGFFVRRKKKRK